MDKKITKDNALELFENMIIHTDLSIEENFTHLDEKARAIIKLEQFKESTKQIVKAIDPSFRTIFYNYFPD